MSEPNFPVLEALDRRKNGSGRRHDDGLSMIPFAVVGAVCLLVGVALGALL